MEKAFYISVTVIGGAAAIWHPFAGAAIAIAALAYGGFSNWLNTSTQAQDEKLARLGMVTDVNAKKLEVLIDEFNRLSNDFHMGKSKKDVLGL